MKNRLIGIDILRIFSVFFVTYAHLVAHPIRGDDFNTYLPERNPGAIFDTTANHWLNGLDKFIGYTLGSGAGGLGVVLFFVISGYLMAAMSERYDRRSFLVNRFFRIMPVLIFSVFFIGLFLALTTGKTFSVASYLASITLTFDFVGVPAVASILWSLAIETMYYLIVALFGTLTIRRLMIFQVALLAVVLSQKLQILPPDLAWLISKQCKFLIVMAVGSVMYLVKPRTNQVWWVFLSVVMAYGALDSHGSAFFGRPVIFAVAAIWVASWAAPYLPDKLPEWLKAIADSVYPMYILHFPIGFVIIYYGFDVINNIPLIISLALIVPQIIAIAVTRTIEDPFVKIGRQLNKASGQSKVSLAATRT